MPNAEIVSQRFKNLEAHLEQENPVLLKVVQSFRELDAVAQGMGLMPVHESYATKIAWWPLISCLGTFSSGKSTFINHFLGRKIQRTGNQAVDDRFTVICYSRSETTRALPGVALDADPRFPLYRISASIEEVAGGEGARIDSYLQLKTVPSAQLKGKIVIDSPGFDADRQRTATLRIVDRIIDLSDLVLVFFDARHPEPGAMRDTLQHLVVNTIKRADAGKFLYILNQIDMTSREDNPEDVVAAWQRALSEQGLTAGRFYAIYSPDAGTPIEDEARRRRYETKRDQDLSEIHERMHSVEIERAYRIVAALDKAATELATQSAPLLEEALGRWKRRVWTTELALILVLVPAFLIWSLSAGHWSGFNYQAPWLEQVQSVSWGPRILVLGGIALIVAAHIALQRFFAAGVARWVKKRAELRGLAGDFARAFRATSDSFWGILANYPRGWGSDTPRQVEQVLLDCDNYVQTLNDRFANPSGNVPNTPTELAEPA